MNTTLERPKTVKELLIVAAGQIAENGFQKNGFMGPNGELCLNGSLLKALGAVDHEISRGSGYGLPDDAQTLMQQAQQAIIDEADNPEDAYTRQGVICIINNRPDMNGETAVALLTRAAEKIGSQANVA